MPHQHHVFLSYSHHDDAIMRRVRSDLEAEGLTVWTDEGIEPGTDNWVRSIEHALENTGCMVVLLTPNAKTSDGVGKEILYARIHEIHTYTLLAQGDERQSIPLSLTDTQYVDVRTDYQSRISRLIEAICTYLGIERHSPSSDPVDIGRESVLDEGIRLLSPPPPHIQITGDAGDGRFMAEELLHRLIDADAMDRVVWVSAHNFVQEALDIVTAALLSQDSNLSLREYLQLYRVTIVFDNTDLLSAPDVNVLQEMLNTLASARVLLICRSYIPVPNLAHISLSAVPIHTKGQNINISSLLGNQITMNPLSPWNPVNWFRLLWWLFIAPERFLAYKNQVGERSTKILGGWLASTLVWLLLFIPVMGVNLGAIPTAQTAPFGVAYSVWAGVIVLVWLMTGLLGRFGEENSVAGVVAYVVAGVVAYVVASSVALIVASSVALGVALGVAFVVAGVVALGVALGVAFVVALFVASSVASSVAGVVALFVAYVVALVVAYVVGRSIKSGRSSIWNKSIFAALILSYAFLIWVYLLGGWHVLSPA